MSAGNHLMPYRYLARIDIALSLLGAPAGSIERWFGFEFDEEVDVVAYSQEHGYDLIPAEGMTEEELASVGVRTFARAE